MRTQVAFCFCGLAAALAGRCGVAAEVKSGSLAAEVRKDGCGFVDAIRFRGRQVVRAPEGFVGARIVLAAPGDGTAESLFAHRAGGVLTAKVREVHATGGSLTIKGSYADGKLSVPFTRRITLDAAKKALAVTEETDFRGLGEGVAVAEHEASLALVVCKDPHLRMLAFGGAHRAEMFRMDMNDIHRGGKQLISAPRGHWPYWDIGGVLQLAGSYRIWKANHADTPAYPVDEGTGAPGWADYSELDWGLTVVVDKPAARSPWAIEIDARKGVLSISPRPASQVPASARALGKRTFGFRLVLHETSWPATRPCELSFALYRKLLEDMATGSRGKSPWVLYGPTGTADVEAIIHRERIQPSAMLRTLYRGDAWQMQARVRAVGISTPRNQPMAEWDRCSQQYLEHLRVHGLPKRAPK